MLQRLDSNTLKAKTRGLFRRSRRQIAVEIAIVGGAIAFLAGLYFWSGNSPQTAFRTEAVAIGNIERSVTS